MGCRILHYPCGKLGDYTNSGSLIRLEMILELKKCLNSHRRVGIMLTYTIKQVAISAVYFLFIVFKIATAAI